MKFFLLILLVLPSTLFSQEKTVSTQEIATDNFSSIVKILMFDSIAESKSKIIPGKGFIGRGTGFIVTEDGLIFTNRHVVDYALGIFNYKFYGDYNDERGYFSVPVKKYQASDIKKHYYQINYVTKASIVVQIFDAIDESTFKLYKANIVSIDTNKTGYDGAILQIISRIIDGQEVKITEKFRPVAIGNSDSTNIGEDLCFYGFPQEFAARDFDIQLNDQSLLSAGKHSGFDFVVNREYSTIKSDVSISGGNSGGPVFNNKGQVIGISFAASGKTGTSFIYKINGMYNLAVKDFALLNKLKEQGLIPPNRTMTTSGIINNPMLSLKLPNTERIKKYNLDQKKLRQFAGGFLYLKGGYGLFNEDAFTIDKHVNTAYETNSDVKLDVKSTLSYQVDLGKSFSLGRFNETNKLGLDISFAKISVNTREWNSSLVKVDSSATLTMNKKHQQLYYGAGAGLIYSTLIQNKFILDFYYKIGFRTIIPGALLETGKIGVYSTPQNDTLSWNNKAVTLKEMDLSNTLGLNFHVNNVTVGFEYNLYKSLNLSYSGLLDPVANNERIGNSVRGTNLTQNFNITLGIAIFNNTHWKQYYSIK